MTTGKRQMPHSSSTRAAEGGGNVGQPLKPLSLEGLWGKRSRRPFNQPVDNGPSGWGQTQLGGAARLPPPLPPHTPADGSQSRSRPPLRRGAPRRSYQGRETGTPGDPQARGRSPAARLPAPPARPSPPGGATRLPQDGAAPPTAEMYLPKMAAARPSPATSPRW